MQYSVAIKSSLAERNLLPLLLLLLLLPRLSFFRHFAVSRVFIELIVPASYTDKCKTSHTKIRRNTKQDNSCGFRVLHTLFSSFFSRISLRS